MMKKKSCGRIVGVLKNHLQSLIIVSGSFSDVGVARLELATTCSQSRYANQLRYTPVTF